MNDPPTLSMANQRAAQRNYRQWAEQPLMLNALCFVFWLTRRRLMTS